MGRFEQADGGTLFLDEIGEIDPATQVKILRFLGERTFERVGGNTTLQSDVRLLAATNKNLAQLVREGLFREDLYFRLHVVRLTLPPLRERPGDIPLLVQAFLKDSSKENGKPLREFSPEAMACLIAHAWPGNVRELRAAVEHGVVMATGSRIQIGDLPETVRSPSLTLSSVSVTPTGPATVPSNLVPATPAPLSPGVSSGYGEAPETPAREEGRSLNLDQHEKTLILQALEKTRGNRAQAARLLGISRRTLYRRLDNLFPPTSHDG
jgi:DNA-binding NtrC family response regulator